MYEEGELSVPPFEPGEEHPWGTDVLGRDMMSLVLAGTQQTLLLAALVVGARVVVGVVLGAVAGWWSGSWVDRMLMGMSETIAAFPTLLLAMTFILALGIREGFRPFVIALCLVGWGALLSNVRRYARSYWWMALYPSLAFFVAILGFNLLGEGVRRLVESIGVVINRLVNRYTVAAAVLIVAGASWVQANTGATVFYQQQADAFDGAQAYEHAKALAHPAFEGRALGTEGMDAAAHHIAQQFEALGLQPAGEGMTYYQERTRSYEELDTVPELVIEDGGPSLSYHKDFIEYVSPGRNLGRGEGKVRFVALGPITRSGAMISSYKKLEELDYSDEILLTFEGDADLLRWVPCKGILIVSESSQHLDRRRTLSSRDPHYLMFGTGSVRGQDIPRLWISEATGRRLLESTRYSVDELRSRHEGLDVNEVFEVPTDIGVTMEVQGTIRERMPVRNVIASWTGASDSRYGGINNQMIVVMAKYDTPPPTPDDGRDDRRYPGVNDNGSGVGAMLEVVRAMKTSGYEPYRTFLFVAYSGEGQEGGEWVYPPHSRGIPQGEEGIRREFRGRGSGRPPGPGIRRRERLAHLGRWKHAPGRPPEAVCRSGGSQG